MAPPIVKDPYVPDLNDFKYGAYKEDSLGNKIELENDNAYIKSQKMTIDEKK